MISASRKQSTKKVTHWMVNSSGDVPWTALLAKRRDTWRSSTEIKFIVWIAELAAEKFHKLRKLKKSGQRESPSSQRRAPSSKARTLHNHPPAGLSRRRPMRKIQTTLTTYDACERSTNPLRQHPKKKNAEINSLQLEKLPTGNHTWRA